MKKSVVFNLFIWASSCLFSLQLIAQTTKDHTVVAGETLYGIARNHQINFNDLAKANPQIINNAINIGDIIHIPTKNNSTQNTPASQSPATSTSPVKNTSGIPQTNPFAGATGVVNPTPTKPATTASNNTTVTTTSASSTPRSGITNNQFAMIEHVVAEKQTLFAISKLYNVSVADIQSWNHLADNNIKVGSILLIRSNSTALVVPTTSTPIKTAPVVEKVEIVKPEIVKPVEVAVAEKTTSTPVLPEPVRESPARASMNVQGQLEEAYLQDRSRGKSLMTSRGTITWINTENAKMSDSYFGLHKTAPIGSIVRVTNLVNKRVVFVKVIGKLPETSDNLNIVLKLSAASKKALLLNGDKAYVDIEYYQ
ncbi:MAG TPA: LysM peptidoglycan-binding domain-containing protein [Chitinophagales bacterium]|nr:LysM peptidoglycan-binding domain-containing protein [Chitinophagales bacterium]